MKERISLNKPSQYTKTTSVFYGIRKGERIPDGYFSELYNMSCSEYPCLKTRNERSETVYDKEIRAPGEPVHAIVHDNNLIIACSNGMIMKGERIIDGMNNTEKLVPFGNSVFCAPSGVLINGQNEISFAEINIIESFKVSFCDSSFSDITVKSGDKPASPSNGQYWYDTVNKGLYKYSTANSQWVALPSVYIKISSDKADFSVFHEGDAISLTSEKETADSFVAAVFSNSIVVEGIISPDIAGDAAVLRIERRFPKLSNVCSHNNRLWGCNYDGITNEIYASRLGDPLNWYCYKGLSTDSYAASCGEEGKFTGCSELGDSVVFFKENCIYTVYGNEPSSFQTVKTDCFGVQEGSEKSICTINGQLYYKSCHGIMRLSEGSLPVCISDDLGVDTYSEGVAGTDGRKYYIVMTDIKGNRDMFVYDTKYELWHKEDIGCKNLFSFVNFKNNLLLIGKSATDINAKPVRRSVIQGNKPKMENYSNPGLYQLAYAAWVSLYIARFIMFQLTDEQIRNGIASEKNVSASDISDSELYLYMASFFNMESSFEHNILFSYISNEATCNARLPVADENKSVQKDEGRFLWKAETGLRGFDIPEYKRVKAVEIRLKLFSGSSCSVSIEYDSDGKWHGVDSYSNTGQGTFRIIHRLNKCDTYRLKIQGFGKAVIYSISETYEEAGNIGI